MIWKFSFRDFVFIFSLEDVFNIIVYPIEKIIVMGYGKTVWESHNIPELKANESHDIWAILEKCQKLEKLLLQKSAFSCLEISTIVVPMHPKPTPMCSGKSGDTFRYLKTSPWTRRSHFITTFGNMLKIVIRRTFDRVPRGVSGGLFTQGFY